MRDPYKKSHWQTSGSSFYERHLLFDRHYDQHCEWMDAIGERVRILGGVSRILACDVHEESRLTSTPSGVESAHLQLARLVDSHEFFLEEARPMTKEASDRGDEGTSDLIVSQLIRGHEAQRWFVTRHLDSRGST